MTRESLGPLGVVYTPPEVARAMTRLALAPLVVNASSTDLLALRICDPAAGTGAFLVEVVSYLADHLVSAWQREGRTPAPTWAHDARSLVARTCIVGVDVDERALHVAVQNVAARNVAVHDRTILRADALSLDWRAAFPDIFARGGFDVVLANPPYIRQESLATKGALESFDVYDGVADLYVYFIELAHRLLRPRGRYCVIVPNKWMTVDYGRRLRSFLARAHSVDGIVDLSQHGLFADADAFPCILWGTLDATRDRSIVAIRASTEESVGDVLHRASMSSGTRAHVGASMSADSASPAGASRSDSTMCDGLAFPRDRWSSEPWHIDSSSDRFLLDRLALAYPTLGEVIGTRWSRGVVTGLNDAFVIDRATREQWISADLECAGWIRPFIKGRDIRPYAPTDIDRFVLLVDRGTSFELLPEQLRDHLARFRERLAPKPPEHVGAWPGRKPGAYAWYELQDPVVPLAKSREPRLFYQDIQTAPACCLDAAGELVPDTTVWILPSSDLYLLAILNSHVYRWYSQRRFPPALNGAVRPKLAYMQRLPVPTPSRDLREEIVAHVRRRLVASASRERDVLDRQIDRFVEHAYQLSSIERALIAS